MQDGASIELGRDCEAVQIPAGNPAVLAKGTQVQITQTLGGSFTVYTPSGLFRISGKDADALGLAADAGGAAKVAPTGPVEEKSVWEALKTCFDPEIPVNIVDLGLVYDLHLEPLPSGQSKVLVKMTLTAPGCGMGPMIARDAQEKILDLPGVEEADVEVVWDPPWHQSMISADGRRVLGLE